MSAPTGGKAGLHLIIISGKHFDWNPDKNIANINKHGISFKEAASIFFDENAVYFDDEKHSQDEDRFIVIGKSKVERLLYTCYCYRENDTVIRIISARKATATESKLYGGAI
jgi:uncharacterized DUF497 family protein